MLAEIGVSSIGELFADLPADLRLGRPLDLPDGLPEAEVFDRLSALAERNADADSELCFLGAGMYDHYVPAIVDAIVAGIIAAAENGNSQTSSFKRRPMCRTIDATGQTTDYDNAVFGKLMAYAGSQFDTRR